MTWAAPKTITNELVERLNMLARSLVLDAGALAQISFQARHLKAESPFYFHVIQGIIAAFKDEPEFVQAEYELARQSRPQGDLGMFYANFARSFADVGCDERVLQLAHEALARCPESKTSIALIRELAFTLGDIDLYLQLWKTSTSPNQGYTPTEDTFVAIEQLLARGIKSEDFRSLMATVRSFLRAKGFPRYRFAPIPMREAKEGGPCFVFRFTLPISPEAAIELESNLFELLFEKNFGAFDTNSLILQIVPTLAGGMDADRPEEVASAS